VREPRAGGRIGIRRRLRSQRGFSLLEVVVAFAILALSLGVLLQIFSGAMNATSLSGFYSRAASLAEARLASVGLEIPLEPGAVAGSTPGGLHWQVVIDRYDPGDVAWEATFQPHLVTAIVSWETAGGSRQVTLSSLRLGEAP
jgi:general secretion pathway protein I